VQAVRKAYFPKSKTTAKDNACNVMRLVSLQLTKACDANDCEGRKVITINHSIVIWTLKFLPWNVRFFDVRTISNAEP